MRKNKPYQIVPTNYYQTSKLKKLFECRLDSSQTRLTSYYGGLEVKKDRPLNIIVLSKVDYNSTIVYVSNWIYGVGEFVLLSKKGMEYINSFNPTLFKKTFIPNQWRHFREKESILNEFVHPIDKNRMELQKLEQEKKSVDNSLLLAQQRNIGLKQNFNTSLTY